MNQEPQKYYSTEIMDADTYEIVRHVYGLTEASCLSAAAMYEEDTHHYTNPVDATHVEYPADMDSLARLINDAIIVWDGDMVGEIYDWLVDGDPYGMSIAELVDDASIRFSE
jgi:hypothetical protein